jgi:HEAT repeat protein
MEKNITDEQLIALLEGEANPELEQLIEKNAALQKRYFEMKEVMDAIATSNTPDVPMHIKDQVQQAIFEEQANLQKGFTWMHIAAAVAILIVGFSLGKLGNSDQDAKQELAALRSEIASLKEVTITSSLKRYSASERIMAVSRIENETTINPELLATLVNTLNSDESPNVRYAALQALANYMDQDQVRYELVKSLESQTDPLIQISLITIMIEAQEKSARVPMKKLIEDEETLQEVKDQAEIALKILV